MPRIAISEIRKRELIVAASELLETQGVSGATLERVAEKAGSSKGIVLHYFNSKQHLFIEVMRYSNANLRKEVVRRLALSRTPEDRLWAIISGNFAPQFFTSQCSQTWLALCAEVPKEIEFRRLQIVIHARMHSNLLSALKMLLDDEAAKEFATCISSLIDGLWLRIAINPPSINRATALKIMLDVVRGRLPSFETSISND